MSELTLDNLYAAIDALCGEPRSPPNSWADVAALELRSAITTGRRMTWMKGLHDGWRQAHRAHAALWTVQAALEHYTITQETGP